MITVYSVKIRDFSDQLSQIKQYLSAEELARSERFVHEPSAHDYIIVRGLLRHLLATSIGCSTGQIQLSENEHGKPFLEDSALQFNVSHSKGHALIALSDEGAVGIDIQCWRELDASQKLLALAKRFFAAEEIAFLKSCTELEIKPTFYRIWTAKEAYVKALGRGISFGFDGFSVVQDHGFVGSVGEWQLAPLKSTVGYSATLALVQGESFQFEKLAVI